MFNNDSIGSFLVETVILSGLCYFVDKGGYNRAMGEIQQKTQETELERLRRENRELKARRA